MKLALKNIKSKRLRTAATVLVIAAAVALLFCMFSFRSVVYKYILATETAASGDADVLISTYSANSSITDTGGLASVTEVDDVVATLSMYTMYDNDYVRIRGFEIGKADSLQKITITAGSLPEFDCNPYSIIVSEAFAKKHALNIGDFLDLGNGSTPITFQVCAIAQNDGYFFGENPPVILARVEGVSEFIVPGGSAKIFNEIYLKTASPNDVISELESDEFFGKFKITHAVNFNYVNTQSDSMSAPVVVAGLSVIFLAVTCIVLISLSTVTERRKYVSKLTSIGATRGQIFLIFLTEALLVAFTGAVIGALLAGGVLLLLVNFTLSSLISFNVSWFYLLTATTIGFVLAVLSVILPILSSFRLSIRENEFAITKKNLVKITFLATLTIAAVACVTIEHIVEGAKGMLSLINILLILATVVFDIPFLYRACAKAISRTKKVDFAILGKFEMRSRHCFSLQLLTVCTTVIMLLFMSWTLTTEIFTGYLSRFEDKIFVTNVPADIADSTDADGISDVDGVKSVTPAVWKQGDVTLPDGNSRTVNILGSADMLDLLELEYLTEESVVRSIVSRDGYVIIDKAYSELYGIQTGDILSFEIDGRKANLVVGGITHHVLFSGNYVIISLDNLKKSFGLDADTVIVVADDPALVADRIRNTYPQRNYYVIETLVMYEWEAESMSAVFDLVGVLTMILALLTYLSLIASAIVEFPGADRTRTALLCAGMSKNRLFGMEIGKNIFRATLSYLVSFAASALMTMSLINALRVFNLYFEYMYNAKSTALVGAAIAFAYMLIPLLLNYKRKYHMKKM